MQGLTPSLIATLLGASAWVIREDLLTHRIPNRLTGSLMCVALALQFALGGWSALGGAALGSLVGLAMLLPLYVLRATGAGDVKFLAAVGAVLGPHGAFIAGVYSFVFGGALALLYLLGGASLAALSPAAAPWTMRLELFRTRATELRREHFPYALAIAAGALAAVAERGDLAVAIAWLSDLRS